MRGNDDRPASQPPGSPSPKHLLGRSRLPGWIFLLVLGPFAQTAPALAQRDDRGTPPSGIGDLLPPIASLVVPGSGQLIRRQERGIAYLFAEAVLAGHAVLSLQEGHRERSFYRDLAFLVARGRFFPSVRDTTFQYFEQMAKFVESGPFDTDPGPALVPPTDPATFNGSVWELARETFFADPNLPPPSDSPQYQRALAFYRDRAVGPGFQWSWDDAPEDRLRYRTALTESDDAFRRGSVILGFVVANHLVSAVDGLITGRLRRMDTGLDFDSGFWDASGVTAGRWSPVVYWKLTVAF